MFKELALSTALVVSPALTAFENKHSPDNANLLCPPGVTVQNQTIAQTGEEVNAWTVIDQYPYYQGPPITSAKFTLGKKPFIESEVEYNPIGGGEYERVLRAKDAFEHVGTYSPYVVLRGEVDGEVRNLFICFGKKIEVYETIEWRIDDSIHAEAGETSVRTFDTAIIDPEGNTVIGAVLFPGDSAETIGKGGKRSNSWGLPIHDVTTFSFYNKDNNGEIVTVWWPTQPRDYFNEVQNDAGADEVITDASVDFQGTPRTNYSTLFHPDDPSQNTSNVSLTLEPPQESYAAEWNQSTGQYERIDTDPPEATMNIREPIILYIRKEPAINYPPPKLPLTLDNNIVK